MEDKQNLVEIHVVMDSEGKGSTTVSGQTTKILGLLAVTLYKVAIESGYTVEEMLEVLEKSFTDFEEMDKIEEA